MTINYTILTGDNRDTLKTIPDNTIDAIVTDPPYGIDFLGKDWDANVGALETYQECLRVLKPGGHILAFSAARTYHHLAVTLEQAGFEIRDQIMWIYSSGFPKSQDVGKSIKRNEKKDGSAWEGWGTALKPAHEPIALARKPMKLSIARNCQQWGVGALNIDATRIPYDNNDSLEGLKQTTGNNAATFENFSAEERTTKDQPKAGKRTASFHNATGGGETQSGGDGSGGWEASQIGRFPSNVIGEIPDYQKYYYCPKVSRQERHMGFDDITIIGSTHPDDIRKHPLWEPEIGTNPARLKAKIIEKGQFKGNNHPTVKPIELMRYLIRLITPPGGTVLDPFMGSGSTGMAAVELGHVFIGCELDARYVEIARTRIEAWRQASRSGTTYEDLFE